MSFLHHRIAQAMKECVAVIRTGKDITEFYKGKLGEQVTNFQPRIEQRWRIAEHYHRHTIAASTYTTKGNVRVLTNMKNLKDS